MTYFPHPPAKRPANTPAGLLASVRQVLNRDILWNQPVFKAPVLPNPRVALDPLPFTAVRVTQRPSPR
jgi:hypothetical protein